MENGKKRITEALKQAMQAENEGYHFYKMAAQNTPDAKGQDIFNLLADDEKGHFEFLKGQYESFLASGRASLSFKLGRPNTFSGTHPIFSEEIKNRIGKAHYEMTALSIGMQLESSAVSFYQAEAKAAADDEVARRFFEDLAEWERGHLAILQKQAELLKEEYWNAGGFSPF